ncbi:MAG: sigma-54 dependent transcriptional regulator [Thermodesulfobacteriota bacterium]|nr:sigma-54 dependent transcriptional regulator [Thermodesulfobacteriota bacterium]
MSQLNPILVVDDESEMRLALSHALARNGYKVTTASCGFDALKKLRKQTYNMVITDVKMPDINGLEILKEIKKNTPQTKVVMITAYGTIESAVEAMKEGAFDFLLKPFSIQVLEKIIKRAVYPSMQAKLKTSLTSSKSSKWEIVSQNKTIKEILKRAKDIANSKSTVLIQGESGTGKELLARYIHENSNRRNHSFIAVNCAAIPEGLIESELFGYEKGAFTGAVSQHKGKFELAHNGTILLDEISELPFPLQAKLLRIIQEEEVDRIGGKMPVPIDIRAIATTNRDLAKVVIEKKFREDLYYRLNVIPIKFIPLRERKEDIPLLAEYFLKKLSLRNNKSISGISREAISILTSHSWRGNIRELENTIERAVLFCEGDTILPTHLDIDSIYDIKSVQNFPAGQTLLEMEKNLILKTLKEQNGNRTKAAKVMGISIRTLRNKLREYKSEGIQID